MEKDPPKRILIVDDEPDLLDLVERRLVKAGFSVTKALNGLLAIETLKAQKFDAVLCDINMPGGISGFDVFDFIHATFKPRMPFIFVTGHGEGTPEMTRALGLGVDAVFSKPVSSKVLIDKLDTLINDPSRVD